MAMKDLHHRSTTNEAHHNIFASYSQVNVGVGAYRCDQGMPFVLPVVREAENEINLEEVDHEYSGIVSTMMDARVYLNTIGLFVVFIYLTPHCLLSCRPDAPTLSTLHCVFATGRTVFR